VPLTYAAAAEEVLKRHSKGAPMHDREIIALAVSGTLIEPGCQSPAASLSVAIRQEIKGPAPVGSRSAVSPPNVRGLHSLTLAGHHRGQPSAAMEDV
jgi:hypothetical protein